MIESKFKNTEIGLIPEDWEVKTIGDFCDITTGVQNTQDKIDNGKYPFYVRSQQVERIDNYLFDTEGVITAGDGVGTGKIFHYVKGKFGLHQRCYLMHNFDSKVFAKYFFMVFSRDFYERVQSMTAKSSVDSVRREMIADMPIPLPPLPEQRRIAKVLSEADDLIKQWENVIAKKRDIKTGTMQLLLTGKKRLNGFDKPWVEKKLGEVAMVTSGSFVHQNYQNPNSKYPVYNGGITNTGFYDYYNYEGEKVLVSARGASAGFVNYEKSKFWAGNSCYVLTVKDKDTFVQFFYRALSFKQYLLIENQQQGSIPAVNKNQLENFVLLFPPTLTEQRAIAEILSDMDEEIKTLEQKVEKMRNIKSGMMQQLLSGKIRLVGDEADNVRQFVENNFGEFALAAEQGKKFAGK